jgi:hypothetical protein
MRITLPSWLILRDAVAVDTLVSSSGDVANGRVSSFTAGIFSTKVYAVRSFPNGGLGHQEWRQSSCNGGNSLVNVYMVELHSAVSKRRS